MICLVTKVSIFILFSLCREDEANLVDEIADKISKNLMTVTTISNGRDLVGIDTHMKALNKKLDLNSNKSLRVVGIWARGYNGRSALAKYVYQDICHWLKVGWLKVYQDIKTASKLYVLTRWLKVAHLLHRSHHSFKTE